MTEEQKLLRALIDALGFEVMEEYEEVPYTFELPAIIGPINPETGLHNSTPSRRVNSTKTITKYKLRAKT